MILNHRKARELKDNIPDIQKQLKENRLKLVQTIERLEELNQKINRENQLKERLHNLKALGLDKKFEEQNIYNKEEAVIKRSDGEFQEIQSLVEELERKISAVDLHYLSVDALKEYINAQNLASLKPVWEKLISELQRAISIIKTAEKTFVTQSNEVKQQWQKAKEQFEEEFQKLINKLPDSGGRKTLNFWEPGAPDFDERLAALKYAFDMRYKTSVSCEPMLDENIDELIFKVSPYVTDSVWLGKLNYPGARLAINGANDSETLATMNELMSIQSDGWIMELYSRYKDNPQIKWKESIKKVVGLEIPIEKGLDV